MKIAIISNYNFDIAYKYQLNDIEWEFVEAENFNFYDKILIFNYSNKKLKGLKTNRKIIQFHQEPGDKILHFWMYSKTNLKIGTIYSPLNHNFSYLPFHVPILNNDYLLKNKIKLISAIYSNKKTIPGHIKRLEIIKIFQKKSSIIESFGKGNNYIKEKKDGLINFNYSICIENSVKQDYFTEKIIDCYLSLTVPIYYGCPNINDYFPKESLLIIDPNNVENSIDKILKKISNEDYKSRLESLIKAKYLCETRYNLINFLKDELDQEKKINPFTINIKKTSKILLIISNLINKFKMILYDKY